MYVFFKVTVTIILKPSFFLQPLLFGMVYSSTVAQFPKGIFVLAAALVAIGLLLISLVRPPFKRPPKVRRIEEQSHDSDDEEEIVRGRSRVSKDLSRRNSDQ